VLIDCKAGCKPDDIVAAIGLTMRDLFPSSNGQPRGRIVKTYDYTDEHGKLLYQVVRFDPKDFRQRRLDGQGGWIWNTKGVRKVLYRLPELLAANPSEPVFIPEGEKDVEKLRSMELIATCNVGGAEKWRNEYNEPLRHRPTVIIQDNDDSGSKQAEQVAHSLHGIAASVKVVALPNVPESGDVSDWLGDDGLAGDLLTLADETAARLKISWPVRTVGSDTA